MLPFLLALVAATAAEPDPSLLANALGARLPQANPERVEAFALYFEAAGHDAGLSPWLLAAVAVQESRLSPFAEGPCGKWACRGIMQIHERWVGAPPFVKSAKARKRCEAQPGACQLGVVVFGARLLRREVRRCGSLAAGLGAYNTGRCSRGQRYAARVGAERDRLVALATAPAA